MHTFRHEGRIGKKKTRIRRMGKNKIIKIRRKNNEISNKIEENTTNVKKEEVQQIPGKNANYWNYLFLIFFS